MVPTHVDDLLTPSREMSVVLRLIAATRVRSERSRKVWPLTLRVCSVVFVRRRTARASTAVFSGGFIGGPFASLLPGMGGEVDDEKEAAEAPFAALGRPATLLMPPREL